MTAPLSDQSLAGRVNGARRRGKACYEVMYQRLDIDSASGRARIRTDRLMDDDRTEGTIDTMVEPKRRRLAIADYQRLVEVGILRSDERVAVIAGEVVEV